MNAKAMQKAAAFLPQPLNGSSNFAFMNAKFEDPFNGWGKKAAAFCIAFAFILPNYFFMTKVLNWF